MVGETKVTIAILGQKFDDFAEYSREKLDSIDERAKFTNGKIADAQLKINALETRQVECPALAANKAEMEAKPNTNINKINIFIAFLAFIVSIIAIFRPFG